MGFGFNIIVLPLALLLTLVFGLLLLFTGRKFFLYALGGVWLPVLTLMGLATVSDTLSRPLALRRPDIPGEYRIDRQFFPGPDADWQYAHYRFVLTRDDSLLFYVTDGTGRVHVHRGTVEFHSGEPPALWRYTLQPPHHVLSGSPLLVRSHTDFYYVLHSSLYQNMFFRKVK